MLNISENSVEQFIDKSKYPTLATLSVPFARRSAAYWVIGVFVVLVGVLFLPWTQNISADGNITTLTPDTRPQSVNATIPGRIEKWYINEGDTVRKGDTIIFISEIKDAYFDPNLLQQVQKQIDAKTSSMGSYTSKAGALATQIDALSKAMLLKIEQAENKVEQGSFKVITDSMDLEAARKNHEIAKKQLDRTQNLFEQDLKSRTQLEEKELKTQETAAKLTSAQNKLLTAKNELLNARLEFSNISNEYADKISKAESDRFSALSALYESESEVAKMQNTYANYNIRKGFYYITASQDGIVVRTQKAGIGEILKEGEEIALLAPLKYELAVEMFVKPMDIPLIRKGEDVRLQFDGWPAIVFSGWPAMSYGTFGGKIYAIERVTNEDGVYRVLVSEDVFNGHGEGGERKPWPRQVQFGGGAYTMTLVSDVPLWYELWRQLNGFPPNYYKPTKSTKATKDKKDKANDKK